MLSLIIPCYKESNRLPTFLESLSTELNHLPIEILIVDDGSPEEEFKKLSDSITKYLSNKIKLIRSIPNLGKGGAIEIGINSSRTELIGFVDADGAIPYYEIINLYNIMIHSDKDMVISSRIKMLGKTVKRNLHRHISGRVFMTIYNFFFSIPVYDTQCGLKIFKRSKYELIKNNILDKRWTWDTQLITLFYLNNFKIQEVAIDWEDIDGSKVNVLKDSIRMIFSLYKLKKTLK
jgi:dolichyl-phosphate beta-glucosyltransferase